MPFWYATAIVLTGGVAVTDLVEGRGWLSAGACAILAGATIMSVVFLVPINNRVREWLDDAAPTGWREILRRWERRHVIRVLVLVAGFALLGLSARS